MDKSLKDTAIGAGTLGAVTAFGPGAAVIKPGADLIQFLWGRATDARKAAMLDGLLNAVADVGHYDHQEAENRLAALLVDCTQDQEDLVYDTFRAMAFGRSREAWRYILRLTAEYIVERQGKPDDFFRRTAWLLERCEADDIDSLRSALGQSRERIATGKELLGEIYKGGMAGIAWRPSKEENSGIQVQSVHNGLSVGGNPLTMKIPDVGQRQYELIGLMAESRLGLSLTPGTVFFPEGGHVQGLMRLFRV